MRSSVVPVGALLLSACTGEIKALPSHDTAETGAPDDSGTPDDSDDTGGTGGALLSLNLHCLKLDGTEYSSNQARFEAIAALVAAEDVVAITAAELCDDGSTDATAALESAIEGATGETWSSVATVAHTAWEGTDDEALESVGVLAQGEIAASGSVTYAVQGGLSRVVTWAQVPALGGATVWSVHLDVDDAEARAAQARETANAALVAQDPGADAIVAGDLNDVEGGDAHGAFLAAGFRDLSADLDADRIDHVFAHRGAAWTATSARLAFDGSAEPWVSDHPGVLVQLTPADGEALDWTRVSATIDVGFGHFLSVRGDVAPLDWDAGWPATALDTDTWRWVSTEIPAGAAFSYKVLVDDVTWQTGSDNAGQGGQDHELSPSF